MLAGKNTYINDWLLKLGFQNIVENEESRYPEITIEQLQQKQVELIMLSSEPYPFKQQHIDELQKHLPTAKILLVDGEMFSWYGSRMLDATNYFKQLLKIHFV